MGNTRIRFEDVALVVTSIYRISIDSTSEGRILPSLGTLWSFPAYQTCPHPFPGNTKRVFSCTKYLLQWRTFPFSAILKWENENWWQNKTSSWFSIFFSVRSKNIKLSKFLEIHFAGNEHTNVPLVLVLLGNKRNNGIFDWEDW